jgi:hypothetical protein
MNDPETDAPPDTCAIAFKEWEGVCDALEGGEQALILRKGGIDEGPGGFAPEHVAFWLYPTRVHQAQQGLQPGAGWPSTAGRSAPEGAVLLSALAVVDQVFHVDRRELLAALDGFHVWTAETVQRRFDYKRPGLWVLGVRVYRSPEPVVLPVTPEHAGCKTWVPLGRAVPTAGATPVLAAGEFRARMERLRAALGGSDEAGGRH